MASRPKPRPQTLPLSSLPAVRRWPQRGWAELDVLFVSGDAYVDHPSFGTRCSPACSKRGVPVGILAQPDWRNPEALRAMGGRACSPPSPPGDGLHGQPLHRGEKGAQRRRLHPAAGPRPPTGHHRLHCGHQGRVQGLPTIIGGIEASLRRLAHYDFWTIGCGARCWSTASRPAPVRHGGKRPAGGGEAAGGRMSITAIRDVRGTAFLARRRRPVRSPSFLRSSVWRRRSLQHGFFGSPAFEASPFNAKPLASFTVNAGWWSTRRPSLERSGA